MSVKCYLLWALKSDLPVTFPVQLDTSKNEKTTNKFFKVAALQPLSQARPSQPAIACSKLTTETLEQGVKYVQS